MVVWSSPRPLDFLGYLDDLLDLELALALMVMVVVMVMMNCGIECILP